jgi:hypothetical protein
VNSASEWTWFSTFFEKAYYNFVRVHKTLRVSRAMAAGVADRLWEVADIVKLVEAGEAKPAQRGPYRKRSAAEVIE